MKPDDNESQMQALDIQKVGEEATDLLADWGEVAIDSFLKEGPVKDIPIVGSLVKIYRGIQTVREQAFLRKLWLFVTNSQHVDPKKKQQFKERLATDRAFAKDTATHLPVVLDRLDEIEKAVLLARIFGAYVAGVIDQAQMRRLSAVLDRTLLADLVALRDRVRNNKPLTRKSYEGLEGAGLAFTYHSIVRPVQSGEIQDRVGDINVLLTTTAVLFVQVAF